MEWKLCELETLSCKIEKSSKIPKKSKSQNYKKAKHTAIADGHKQTSYVLSDLMIFGAWSNMTATKISKPVQKTPKTQQSQGKETPKQKDQNQETDLSITDTGTQIC